MIIKYAVVTDNLSAATTIRQDGTRFVLERVKYFGYKEKKYKPKSYKSLYVASKNSRKFVHDTLGFKFK